MTTEILSGGGEPRTAVLSPTIRPRSPEAERLRALAAELTHDMADRWRQGERPRVEDYFASHPEIANDPEAAVQLICEEMCLRQDAGQAVDPDEILGRFPQWRDKLAVVLDCHRLLQPETTGPAFPEVGECLGDCQLVSELGRGAQGRVFLATQPQLADRPVVLKVGPLDGREHLSLARLQHTHIVPLLAVQDDRERRLRTLLMPYFGGATLEPILDILDTKPPASRTGQDLLKALDRAQVGSAIPLPAAGHARRWLASKSYVEAVCWIGSCLADALQYAHERNLAHLDLKPSNVLLTADAMPMLLDFHLCREPLRKDGPTPDSFGGTQGYMSPEQVRVLEALQAGLPIPEDVDHRSDIYSLGLVLFWMLGGIGPEVPGEPYLRLNRCNRQVSTGLADVIARCLHPNPARRYQSAGELADDLRYHLANQPLRGVPNRSLRERWRKWRRRRPRALALGVMFALLLAALAGTGGVHLAHVDRGRREAQAALVEGQEQLRGLRLTEAATTLRHGLALAEGQPGCEDLTRNLHAALQLAQQARAAQDLHALADRIRFLWDEPAQALATLAELEAACRQVWEGRQKLLACLGKGLGEDFEQRLRTDLLDLAVLGSDLRARLAPKGEAEAAHREALKVLNEAEALSGPSPVLYQEYQAHAKAVGMTAFAESAGRVAAAAEPRTAWEFYSRGRALLRANRLKEARKQLDEALARAPQSFWSHFHQGKCAYRMGQFAEAVAAFRTCIALEPARAECYYNRGLAYAALKDEPAARRDYDRALELNPHLAAAALNRGIFELRGKQFDKAVADLQRALADGADPAVGNYNLALAHFHRQDYENARASVRQALRRDPAHAEARKLAERLRRKP